MNFNRDYLEQFRNGQATVSQRGSGLPPVTYNQNDPTQTMAQIIERDEARYQQDYVPVEDRAIASLDDMSIIEDAGRRVADKSGLERAMGRVSRDSGRYGFRVTNSQQQDAMASLQIDRAASDADTMNDARLNQFDRNRGFRNELINIGRGVSGQAQEGLTAASQMQQARDSRNAAASAQAKASRTSMLGSLGALAILAL